LYTQKDIQEEQVKLLNREIDAIMQSKSRLEELKNKELDDLANVLEEQQNNYRILKNKYDDYKKEADKE